jgi:riboflavin synthase
VFTGLIASLGRVEALVAGEEGATLRVSTPLACELAIGDSVAVDGVCLTAIRACAPARVPARDSPSKGTASTTGGGADGDRVGGGGGTVDAADGAADGGASYFEAEAIHETLRRSTLGSLSVGDPVNLELALRADARLGGHVVQGHVDGIATVAAVREEGFSRVLAIDLPTELLPLVVEKGSIALAGVSLTVSALQPTGIEVSLIPETLSHTTLGRLAAGDRLNVEADILAKHVQRLLGTRPASR